MKTLLLLPVVLSFLLLAAHFLRGGGALMTIGIVGLLFLLAVRRPWSARLVQAVLVLGALEWVRTLLSLAARRVESGEPAGRLVVILSVVVAFTACSALVFQTRTLARTYGLQRTSSSDG